jgi:hypothetical protein
VASEVWSALITSTSFITGTGFMKCMPMTLSGRLVTLASLVIEMEEVLLAMMASGLSILSIALRTDCLTLIFSTMA